MSMRSMTGHWTRAAGEVGAHIGEVRDLLIQASPPGLSGSVDERHASNFVFVHASEIPTPRGRFAAACRSTAR